MNTQLEFVNRIAFVIPHGRLDFGAAGGFQGNVDQALAGAGTLGVVIDCAALDYVSSAGLRVFLVAARSAKRLGVAFAVCSLRPSVREVFEVSGFRQLMAVYPDRALAVEHMPA